MALRFEDKVEERERADGFGYGHGSRYDAGVVSPSNDKVGIAPRIEVDALLFPPDGRRGLHGHLPDDGHAG